MQFPTVATSGTTALLTWETDARAENQLRKLFTGKITHWNNTKVLFCKAKVWEPSQILTQTCKLHVIMGLSCFQSPVELKYRYDTRRHHTFCHCLIILSVTVSHYQDELSRWKLWALLQQVTKLFLVWTPALGNALSRSKVSPVFHCVWNDLHQHLRLCSACKCAHTPILLTPITKSSPIKAGSQPKHEQHCSCTMVLFPLETCIQSWGRGIRQTTDFPSPTCSIQPINPSTKELF